MCFGAMCEQTFWASTQGGSLKNKEQVENEMGSSIHDTKMFFKITKHLIIG